MAKRLTAMGTPGYENGFALTLLPERLNDPFKRKKPSVYFVNSMSDLFHDRVPDDYIAQVFDVIARTPHHTYQILTKRAARMARYFRTRPVPTNAWLGVSVEDQKHGVPRIDYLRQVPATIRFLSVEPLLSDVGELNLKDIHWVIVGGESGPKARPMKTEWAESVREQCQEQEVAFFFKQWGGWGADGLGGRRSFSSRRYRGGDTSWRARPARSWDSRRNL